MRICAENKLQFLALVTLVALVTVVRMVWTDEEPADTCSKIVSCQETFTRCVGARDVLISKIPVTYALC